MNERRKAKRVIITAVAEVNSFQDRLVQEGYVANISKTGIGVYMKRPFKLNRAVEIKMSFYTSTGVKDVERIAGKVKRVVPFANVYSVGIQFDGLDPKKDKELISYLKTAQQEFSP